MGSLRRGCLILLGFVCLAQARTTRAQDGDFPTTDGALGGLSDPGTPGSDQIAQGRFHDSTFVWFHNVGAYGLVKSSQLTWNPVYSWLFRVYPRLYLTDKLSLRLKAGLGIEWTDADDTLRYHETRWEDLWFDVVYSPLYREPRSRIEFSPSLRLILPASKESQAESLYVGIAPGFVLRRSFDLPGHGSLGVAYAFRYTKNFNRYTTVQYDAPTIVGCGAIANIDGAACDSLLHSGSRVASQQFYNSAMVEGELTRKFKLAVMVALFHSLLYGVTPAIVPLAGSEVVPVGEDAKNNTRLRTSIWYLVEASYQVHPLLGLSLGISTLSPQLAEDATRQKPFFNRYTEIVFSTTLFLDQGVSRARRLFRPADTRPAQAMAGPLPSLPKESQ